MTDYKVNLPKTTFPMKADLPKREPKTLKFWQSIDLYNSFANPKKSCGSFALHDGPPYANGKIHLGHAFGIILKDIINKSKLLNGYKINYIPGWDCHGLPIELNVEKKIGKAGLKVSIPEFINTCRSYANEQMQLQMEDFERLGIIADWDNRYCTMDFNYEADTIKAFAEILTKGYVIRGYKPVYWCIHCGSSLAEAEVEYNTKTSPAIDVKFTVVDNTNSYKLKDRFGIDNLSIPIWTTTPWTLPANEAVCLHPELNYVLVKCSDLNDNLIILEDLLVSVMKRYKEHNYRVIKKFLGSDLKDLVLKHPFYEKTVPVILGDYVTTDTGTGAVHTAPSHGQEDYKIGLKYKLPTKCLVGANGKFMDHVPIFAQEEVFSANDHVIEVLKQQGKLLCAERIDHSYPHCWRHRTPLIFLATQQWFIGMDNMDNNGQTLRKLSLEAIEKVNWIPLQDKERIKKMVELRPDWCISRQRIWGVPLALFIHKETGEIHPQMQRFLHQIIIPNIEKKGVIYWHNLDLQKFLAQHAPDTIADNYEKVTDVLDVWFDSGATHYCVSARRPDLSIPADLYVEGIDQYRGWFQSSLLTAVALYGHAPYKSVISHGFTVDANGRKMSKLLGNVISPQQIISKYGADIVRLWTASTYLHGDLAASDEIFARVVDAYRMFRNTARFLLGNLAGFDLSTDLVPPKEMLALDRFSVWQILCLEKNCHNYYDSYQFHLACALLQEALSNELSGFYFSIIKDRLYTMPPNSLGRNSAQTALFYILETIIRLVAPILSFTAEELWQEIKSLPGAKNREQSVFMSSDHNLINNSDFDITKDIIDTTDWENIRKIRLEVNKELEKLRAAGEIGSSLEAEVIMYCSDIVSPTLAKLQDELRFMLITSSAKIKRMTTPIPGATVTSYPGLSLKITPTKHPKCIRCWHHNKSVGLNLDHPQLCPRCIENLFGNGEKRCFV